MANSTSPECQRSFQSGRSTKTLKPTFSANITSRSSARSWAARRKRSQRCIARERSYGTLAWKRDVRRLILVSENPVHLKAQLDGIRVLDRLSTIRLARLRGRGPRRARSRTNTTSAPTPNPRNSAMHAVLESPRLSQNLGSTTRYRVRPHGHHPRLRHVSLEAAVVADFLHRISPLGANSLRTRTGNFLRRCREFKLPIREVSGLIRESRFCPLFGPTKPILPRDSAVAEEKRGTPQMLAWPMARYAENHSPSARRTLAIARLGAGAAWVGCEASSVPQPAALPRQFLC